MLVGSKRLNYFRFLLHFLSVGCNKDLVSATGIALPGVLSVCVIEIRDEKYNKIAAHLNVPSLFMLFCDFSCSTFYYFSLRLFVVVLR